jgi:hypothetical protein
VIRSLIGTLLGVVVIFAIAYLTQGCGASWTASDTKGATDVVLSERAALSLCSMDGGCDPGQVRALQQAALCSSASMLTRHSLPMPAGAATGCQP